jgi:hypothetical protein
MNIYSPLELLQAHCKTTKQFGLYISFETAYTLADAEELLKAAPILRNLLDDPSSPDLTGTDFIKLMATDTFCATFSSEAEARAAFKSTIGDDGPNTFNSYNGPANVYACLIGFFGNIITENT